MPELPTPHPSVLHRPVSDGAVLLHAEEEVYFGLNEVGSRIWGLLPPESPDFDALIRSLGAVYPDVDEATLRADVRELLDELRQAGLVRDSD